MAVGFVKMLVNPLKPRKKSISNSKITNGKFLNYINK